MIKKYFFTLLAVVISVAALAQTGGDNTYEFLNLPATARTAAMGGTYISVRDNDLNLLFQNPSALNIEMNNKIALNYVDYLSDIKYGYVAYAKDYKSLGTFAAGMQYINYGKFIAADNTGLQTGTFSAAEYSFNLSYARPLGDSSFTIGTTLKNIYSQLESYHSYGVAADFAVTYFNIERQFCAALVVKNIGTQITTYTPDNKEPLPFEIQMGLSAKLKKAPFRFNLNITHLEKFDITYKSTSASSQTDPVTGLPVDEEISTGSKIMRHLIPGLEILFSKNFHLRFAYNFQRRKELGLDSRMSTVGFSGGIGLRISKFHLSYGRAIYNLAGGTNTFSVAFDLDEFAKKR